MTNKIQYIPVSADSDYKRIPHIFEEDDFAKMIKVIRDNKYYPRDYFWKEWMKKRDMCIVALMWHCGLRPKECLRLRFSDFNAKDISFHISGANNHSHKDRKIPIPEAVFPFIESYLSLGKRSEWLFPSFKNLSTPISSSTWKRIFREKILKPAGLWIPSPDKHIMPRTRSYSMRATFACRFLEKSKNPMMLQYLMGHSDFRSLKHYIKLTQISKKMNMDFLREQM